MKPPRIVLLCLGAVLLLPGAAQASRGATGAERAAILADTYAPARRCSGVRVSTAAPGWAVIYTRSHRGRCLAVAGNGFSIERRVGGRWTSRYAGSDCVRPRNVPGRVWRDIARCSR